MYISHNTQPTRKAFQELTGIKDRQECAVVLCIETEDTRWGNCRNTLNFANICLSNEHTPGEITCVSPDASKAKWTNVGHSRSVNFILTKNNEIDTEDKICKAINCLTEVHPYADVIFFERIRDFSNGLKFIDFVKFIKKHLPPQITAVFSLPEKNIKNTADCFDVVVFLTEKQAYVESSKTLMNNFNFMLKA